MAMQVHKTAGLVFTIATIFSLPLSAIAQSALVSSDRPAQLDCLVGYPDRSFRGDRALTRYELAAGMAACLDPLNQQVNLLKTDASPKSDFKTILQTQQDLTEEIKRLQERLDNLR
ncbi:MAG: hypothetical protein LH647_23750 [Leptolyngbyaceae cyanobacterium CAN_BIN12]|nr:hypothetical protein [Leptolyngbyaceae cyanobacterium CAN_BIN12]